MKRRKLLVLFVPVAIIAIVVTNLRPAHFPSGATEAGAQGNERAAASDGDSITYYLLNESELTTLAGARTRTENSDTDGFTATRVEPHSVIAVVGGASGESRLRRIVDEANRQVTAFGEPGFRIVDLRPSTPADGGGIGGS